MCSDYLSGLFTHKARLAGLTALNCCVFFEGGQWVISYTGMLHYFVNSTFLLGSLMTETLHA